MFFKQFGGKVTDQLKEQYKKSPNWREGVFQNLETTELAASFSKMPGMIYKQLTQGKEKEPEKPLPIVPFNKAEFLAPSPESKFIWYGHSVVMMRMSRKTLLIDPMLGPNTTPIAPIATKRFSENTLSLIDDFPEIDLILLTHDHYDHLDLASIQKIKSKTKKYFVALGVKRHLVHWGVEPEKIIEFDWWENKTLENISVTFTPTRHFSGRGLTDRTKTLWGGWNFKTEKENIWFSGDGGYGKHFQEIGKKLGPFDFAFMECGQYNYDWHPIHMFPNESVQAAIETGAKKAMPVHWAGFALSYQHSWKEPVEDFIKSAEENKLNYSTPTLGKIFTPSSLEYEKWWVEKK